ncbi:hypothetical protein F5Y01DRAFT_292573 [Xylaria sp. FL0043]|nr:hypothetical protein F5Y01DRAFT_292573 [Xylaria sp. FL0043]
MVASIPVLLLSEKRQTLPMMPSTSPNHETFPPGVEYPPRADLRKDVQQSLPTIPLGTIDPSSMEGDISVTQAQAVLGAFNSALASGDASLLAGIFHAKQAFWRDIAALTSHWRTFTTPSVVAAALLEMKNARQLEGIIELVGDPHFAVVSPTLMFIDCTISFRTSSPALGCMGKMMLLPVVTDLVCRTIAWEIWVLSTWTESLLDYPEDEKLLSVPGRQLRGLETVEIPVFILGAGTSGLMTAARLKALGVESVVAERNDRIGDNWLQRYDSLRLHVPTSNCEMPYSYYREELQTPHRLTKYDIAEHLIQYAEDFHLNVLLSARVQSTVFDPSEKKWTVKLKLADEPSVKTIICKHLVQATGFGSGKPYVPSIPGNEHYRGIVLHSSQYGNAQTLARKGVKSVAVIGSANTAFDVIQDCHAEGLQTTMVARSPTYIFPFEYVMNHHAIGAYDLMPLDAADKLLNTMPQALDGRFSHGLFAHLASLEPDRYLALSQAGFPVLDSRDPSVDIQHHLVERGGGHYVDVGGTKLISEGKVAVRGYVEPTSYTDTGLSLSDGSSITADAVIWCTGFADFQATAVDSFGGAASPDRNQKDVLTPEEIVARMDACWGVDAEGEVRGMAKRHLRLENYWNIGGNIQQQRWSSRHMVQQIKLALEDSLPPAYLDTPRPDPKAHLI